MISAGGYQICPEKAYTDQWWGLWDPLRRGWCSTHQTVRQQRSDRRREAGAKLTEGSSARRSIIALDAASVVFLTNK